ncbi:MAG TPA: hypothetical protein VIV11_15670, partial [Kofleriaceae bacterium]
GTQPRIVTFDDLRWLVWLAGGQMHAARFDAPDAEVLIDGLPATAPDAFEVATDRVFAVFGRSLWTIACSD